MPCRRHQLNHRRMNAPARSSARRPAASRAFQTGNAWIISGRPPASARPPPPQPRRPTAPLIQQGLRRTHLNQHRWQAAQFGEQRRDQRVRPIHPRRHIRIRQLAEDTPDGSADPRRPCCPSSPPKSSGPSRARPARHTPAAPPPPRAIAAAAPASARRPHCRPPPRSVPPPLPWRRRKRQAASASSSAAGNGCSGANRKPTARVRAPAARPASVTNRR